MDKFAIERLFEYDGGMSDGGFAKAERLLDSAFAALRQAAARATDTDLVDGLRISARIENQAQRFAVDTVAALTQRGVFARHGQRPEYAVADLLGVEHGEARRVVAAAEQARPRVDLQGQPLPPRLPGTAAALDAGTAGLRHVEVITRLLDGPAARRLDPDTWADAETQLAAHTGDYTPTQLRAWGAQLIDALDQDGPAPDDPDPVETNELLLTRRPDGGGWLKARFDDAAMYATIAALIDTHAAPRTAEDTRPLLQRQAEAMAEIFGWVAEHGDPTITPSAGGRRPQVTVHIRLEDLQNRARAACLDFGGTPSPAALRRLCCDAAVIPIVLDGAGQPLDVGRATRTIPDGLRRAVAARDRGCAHPGCTRPPSWSEIHHIVPWEAGGATTLSNLVTLCTVHHRQIHSSGWSVRIAPDGLPEFFPPTWIDPQQRPRRKPPAYPPPSPVSTGWPSLTR